LEQLHSLTNVILFSQDENAYLYANKYPHKGIYELYVMKNILYWVNSDWYVKLNGRYSLLPHFNINDLTREFPVFSRQDLVIYSFPYDKLELFKTLYRKLYLIIQHTDESLESLFFQNLGIYEELYTLNIIGRDAIESFDRIL
jgi:hypothetical protein